MMRSRGGYSLAHFVKTLSDARIIMVIHKIPLQRLQVPRRPHFLALHFIATGNVDLAKIPSLLHPPGAPISSSTSAPDERVEEGPVVDASSSSG